MVQSAVHCNFENMQTEQRPVLTGLNWSFMRMLLMYVHHSINVEWRHCMQVYSSKHTQEHQNRPRNEGDMAKFMKYYNFGHISSISGLISMLLGAF